VEVGLSNRFRTDSGRYVQIIIVFICALLASLVSRYRNKEKQDEEDVASLDKQAQKDRSIRMHQAMERLNFATKSKADQDKIAHDYDRDY